MNHFLKGEFGFVFVLQFLFRFAYFEKGFRGTGVVASGIPVAAQGGAEIVLGDGGGHVGSEPLGNARCCVIGAGESIAEPLKRAKVFPPMVTHMIAVGEKTGQLEAMLENVSRAYEADVETRVVALTSLLEPLMIVLLGGVVGFIAMAILMPLIQMNELVQ